LGFNWVYNSHKKSGVNENTTVSEAFSKVTMVKSVVVCPRERCGCLQNQSRRRLCPFSVPTPRRLLLSCMNNYITFSIRQMKWGEEGLGQASETSRVGSSDFSLQSNPLITVPRCFLTHHMQ
jgi:hypothetical protein